MEIGDLRGGIDRGQVVGALLERVGDLLTDLGGSFGFVGALVLASVAASATSCWIALTSST